MQVGRSTGTHSPIIFDGQGRLYMENGHIVVGTEGFYDNTGPLRRVSRTDFEIERELGSGQYGTVWSVTHIPTGSKMAIKVVNFSVSETGIKQILTELDILVRSNSPFIIKCFGAFCSDASIYFCMELMAEGSMDKVLQRHPLKYGKKMENVLRAISFSVICALKLLREAFSVIHRDIKPSNILVGSDGSIKICDFGISGYLAQSLARTRIGTSNYMAPERISLGGNELGGGGYGIKSDVWSLGATLMEIITGDPPFPISKYDCIFAQLMDIIYSDPPKISGSDQISKELACFVDSCLQKLPSDRPSYAELLQHPFLSDMNVERSHDIVKLWLSDDEQ